ncbi:hypothetical protein CP533_0509, partial [Ophiocordyceps camponoti-saundersi (nom. inval.)]
FVQPLVPPLYLDAVDLEETSCLVLHSILSLTMSQTQGLSTYFPGPITGAGEIIRVLLYDEALVEDRWERYQNGEEFPELQHVERRLYIVPSGLVNVSYSKGGQEVFAMVSRKAEHTFFNGLNDYVCYDAERGLFAFRGEIRFFRQFCKFIAKLIGQGSVKEAIVTSTGLKGMGSIQMAITDGINPGKQRAEYEDHIKTLACVLFLHKGPDVNEWMNLPVLVKPIRPHLEFRSAYGFEGADDLSSQWQDEVVTMSEILTEKVVCAADVILAEYYNGDRYGYWLRHGN